MLICSLQITINYSIFQYCFNFEKSLNFSLHHRQPQNDVGTILIFILMEHLSDTPCDDLGVVFQSDDQFFLGTRFQCVRSENLLIHQDDASLFLTNILNLNTCLLDLADLSW